MKRLILIGILLIAGCKPLTPEQHYRQQQWIQNMQGYIQGMNQQEQQRMRELNRWSDRQREINALEGIERNTRK